MKTKSHSLKYTASSTGEFQPGSRDRVLKNLLGITSKRALDKEEMGGFIEADVALQSEFRLDQRLTLEDVHRIHRLFLGRMYAWAGQLRDVNITKGGFTFASAYALPDAMKEFEREVLSTNTPCHGNDLDEIASKIAIVHTEFLLLHPYREGNGRTARLLATVMAYQAGLPSIDLGFIKSRGKEFNAYVAAVQAGLSRNYAPMTAIILRGLHLAIARHR